MWNANFMTILFCITRIECSSIWVINMMAMGELELQCVGTHGESTICLMWWTCPAPLSDMEVPTHILVG
jgi:hypothetical protein